MGLLWLSTVPLTSGIVAQIFGLKFMATLFGIVFLSHQIGSFIGVWMGGVLYDRTGSYDTDVVVRRVLRGVRGHRPSGPSTRNPSPRLRDAQGLSAHEP